MYVIVYPEGTKRILFFNKGLRRLRNKGSKWRDEGDAVQTLSMQKYFHSWAFAWNMVRARSFVLEPQAPKHLKMSGNPTEQACLRLQNFHATTMRASCGPSRSSSWCECTSPLEGMVQRYPKVEFASRSPIA